MQVKDRLIVQRKLLFIDAAAEIDLKFDPLHQSLVHLGFENDVLALAIVFCQIHCQIGITEQLF